MGRGIGWGGERYREREERRRLINILVQPNLDKFLEAIGGLRKEVDEKEKLAQKYDLFIIFYSLFCSLSFSFLSFFLFF